MHVLQRPDLGILLPFILERNRRAGMFCLKSVHIREWRNSMKVMRTAGTEEFRKVLHLVK